MAEEEESERMKLSLGVKLIPEKEEGCVFPECFNVSFRFCFTVLKSVIKYYY